MRLLRRASGQSFDFYTDRIFRDFPAETARHVDLARLRADNEALRPPPATLEALYSYLSENKDPREANVAHDLAFHRLVIDAAPGFIPGYAPVTNALLQEGRTEEANALFRQQLELNPFAPTVNEPYLLL